MSEPRHFEIREDDDGKHRFRLTSQLGAGDFPPPELGGSGLGARAELNLPGIREGAINLDGFVRRPPFVVAVARWPEDEPAPDLRVGSVLTVRRVDVEVACEVVKVNGPREFELLPFADEENFDD